MYSRFRIVILVRVMVEIHSGGSTGAIATGLGLKWLWNILIGPGRGNEAESRVAEDPFGTVARWVEGWVERFSIGSPHEQIGMWKALQNTAVVIRECF